MKTNFFSKPFFESWLDSANPKIKEWFKKEIEFLKRSIDHNSKILDVGCGFGRHIELLADFSEEIIGIDDSAEMIKKAKTRLSNFKNVHLFVQDAQKLKFDDDYFDYIICMTNTFGDFPETKEIVLKEMKRVCKKGGKIIISVYNDRALEIRKQDYGKVGLHITDTKGGTVYTKEGLVSEQFSKPQLKDLFDKQALKSKILELNSISFLCILER